MNEKGNEINKSLESKFSKLMADENIHWKDTPFGACIWVDSNNKELVNNKQYVQEIFEDICDCKELILNDLKSVSFQLYIANYSINDLHGIDSDSLSKNLELSIRKRDRHYGICKNDEFFYPSLTRNKEDEVKGFIITTDGFDNNGALARITKKDGSTCEIKVVCEWCDLIIKEYEDAFELLTYEFKRLKRSYSKLEKSMIQKFCSNKKNYNGKRLSEVEKDFRIFLGIE